MKLSKDQIETAVVWWMNAMRRPKFDNLSAEEKNDRRNDNSFMAGMMAQMMPRPAEDKVEKFGESLRVRLESRDVHCLFVDYCPEGELHEACKFAGIDAGTSTLPWKTSMWFARGGVQVKCGYGADTEEILLAAAPG